MRVVWFLQCSSSNILWTVQASRRRSCRRLSHLIKLLQLIMLRTLPWRFNSKFSSSTLSIKMHTISVLRLKMDAEVKFKPSILSGKAHKKEWMLIAEVRRADPLTASKQVQLSKEAHNQVVTVTELMLPVWAKDLCSNFSSRKFR